MKTLLFVLTGFLFIPLAFTQEAELSDCLQKAQYRKAIEYIDRQEATKDLLYQKAICYCSLNDFSTAIEILDSLSTEYPDDIPVKLQLALCYESISLYPKGIACYEDLIKADSTNIYFQVRRADLLFRAEKYLRAIEAYDSISDYNQGYLKKCIALCYDKINQPDSAKVYFSQAWELNEKDVFSALNLVKIHIKQEDFLSALNDSEKFISCDSTNAQLNALNAHAYYSINAYQEAAERFEKCRVQGDSSLIVNRGLGISYYCRVIFRKS